MMGISRRNSGLNGKKFRFCPTKTNLSAADLLKKTSLFVPRSAPFWLKNTINSSFYPQKKTFFDRPFLYLYRIKRRGLYYDYRLRSAKVIDNQEKLYFSQDKKGVSQDN